MNVLKKREVKRKVFTKDERLQIYNKYNGHCAYCGCKLEYKDMQVDHLKSVYNHPNDEHINDFENLMPSCRSCNHRKGASDLEAFRKGVEKFTTVLMRDSVTYKNAVRFGQVIPNPHKVVFYFEEYENEEIDKSIHRGDKEWISVEDELPKYGEYLGYIKGRYTNVEEVVYFPEKNLWENARGYPLTGSNGKVLYWMNKPKPPKDIE